MPRKRLLEGEAKLLSLSEAKDNCVLVLDGDTVPDDEWPVYAAN